MHPVNGHSDDEDLQNLLKEEQGKALHAAADAGLHALRLLGGYSGAVTPAFRMHVAKALCLVLCASDAVVHSIEATTAPVRCWSRMSRWSRRSILPRCSRSM